MSGRGLSLRRIGSVRNGAVVLHRAYSAALDGIEGFSHLLVVFWLHESRRPALKIHPKGRKDLPLTGLLATRSPHRFNPIGITVVKLLRRSGSRLTVEGLDAWDGTPVLDIKPYDSRDAVRGVRVPSWVRKVDRAQLSAV